ncbi:F-box protein [Acorus calamus]|uniref:F-box protein n=1 Tax=Acorus calamus TaxID=4465 RepID=A0AAV9BY98_ACOCL|nr:F-box protein [Acorus calamus]
MEGEEVEAAWSRVKVPQVLSIVGTRLSQRDLYSLLLLSPWCYRSLLSHPSLWQVLDLHEMNKGGERLIAALSLSRYCHVRQINLEFAQDVEDIHLILLKSKAGLQYTDSLKELQSLNLNGCRKISDEGIEAITSACPNLKVFSIYWNVRSPIGMLSMAVQKRLHAKNISDHSLHVIADNYQQLEMLNLTRCVKLTDSGLRQILLKYNAYKEISSLTNLRFLDLCGAPYSLFGIVGVTDKCLEALSKTCSQTLTTLDVNGCIGIEEDHEEGGDGGDDGNGDLSYKNETLKIKFWIDREIQNH